MPHNPYNCFKKALQAHRFAEAAVWAVARWADTYILANDNGGNFYAAIHANAFPARPCAEFTDGAGVYRAMEMLTNVVKECLLNWRGVRARAFVIS